MSRFHRAPSNLHVSQQAASFKSRSVCRDFIATTATSMYPSSRHHSKPSRMSRFHRDPSNLHVSQQVASYKSRLVCRDFIATQAKFQFSC